MDDRRGNLQPVNEGLANTLEESRLALEKMDKMRTGGLHGGLASGIPSVFLIGEELEIKNSKFKVVGLGKKYMRLQILPHD